jgi:hypothetical protein
MRLRSPTNSTGPFATLRKIHPDVPLGSHPGMYNMADKYAKVGKGPNPYIDPAGYTTELDIVEGVFRSQLAQQQKQP